jgi:hypothetical protein
MGMIPGIQTVRERTPVRKLKRQGRRSRKFLLAISEHAMQNKQLHLLGNERPSWHVKMKMRILI